MSRVFSAVFCIVELTTVASATPIGKAAAWELRLLGLDSQAKLKELRQFPKRRAVKLAIVGQGGVSKKHLNSVLVAGNTLTYHGCDDPRKNTHDTQAAKVILDLTIPLAVKVELHIWQPGKSFSQVAECFRRAAKVADVVALYQSFWGPDAKAITDAIRESPAALFISPYVEHKGNPTSITPQGSACRPWDNSGIAHFVTVAPLARRKSKGRILTPSDRGPEDSEPINFIAPSYYASGPGGTCPSAEVAAACAIYLHAVAKHIPTPNRIIELMRSTSKIDRKLLTSVNEFDDDAINRLEKQINLLHNPPVGKQRKLDAPGVINLYDAFQLLTKNN